MESMLSLTGGELATNFAIAACIILMPTSPSCYIVTHASDYAFMYIDKEAGGATEYTPVVGPNQWLDLAIYRADPAKTYTLIVSNMLSADLDRPQFAAVRNVRCSREGILFFANNETLLIPRARA